MSGCEESVELRAREHAGLGLAVAPAIVADFGALRIARSPCEMQLIVSHTRLSRRRTLAPAVSSTDVIAPTAGRSPGGRRRCGRRVSDPLAASEARTPASAGTLEQPGWRLAPFHATSHLTRPLSGDDDRAAVSARLRSCSSRRVLSGDILAASGVQRTAVQRPPTLRLIKRVAQRDSIHTRVNCGHVETTTGKTRRYQDAEAT